MLDKRQVELLLDRVSLDRLPGETPDEALTRWWQEHGEEFSTARLGGRPVVNVCRTL